MRTIELPRDRWVEQLNTFSLAHEGWLTTLSVFEYGVPKPADIVNLPLIGVSADKDLAHGTVVVSVARTRMAHLTRIFHGVTRIMAVPALDGVTASLFIETADGTTTVVQVNAPARLTRSISAATPTS